MKKLFSIVSMLMIMAMLLGACTPAAAPTEAPAVPGGAATEAPAAEVPTEAPVAAARRSG